MSAPVRLAAFAAVLAVAFGGAAVAGGAIDPSPPGSRDAAPRDHAKAAMGAEEHPKPAAEAGVHGSGDDGEHDGGGGGEHAVRGLAVAQDGLRLVVDRPELRRDATQRLSLRIVDSRGSAVRDFDVEHTERMHLIVVRRDMTGFQHLHPTMAADGTWSTPITVRDAGSYRVFADFSHDGDPVTLASDLRVDGAAELRALPAPRAAATSDGGYDVRLVSGPARAGEPTELRFSIAREGHAVHVEPYLGADGHLVALRDGDLAFLHVHPSEHGHEAAGTPVHDDSIGFEATFPTTGRYRLFLQFRHEGQVRTVAFTQEVR